MIRSRTILLALLLALPVPGRAQEDSTAVTGKKNTFTVDANILMRGELRYGGLPSSDGGTSAGAGTTTPKKAAFILERTRLAVGYERKWLSARVEAQHSGTWGSAENSQFSLYQAWVQLSSRQGLFAKVGRQNLSYDDQRIFGADEWAVTGMSHDALILGYEGKGHKLHLIGAYNQNLANINGGSYFSGGLQPYKAMEALWYHYDVPRTALGFSVLFADFGMQAGEKGVDEKIYHQQVTGAYVSYRPRIWSAEAAFYYQMGREEHGLPLRAWMCSAKASVKPVDPLKIVAGYDYLSGDVDFSPPKLGALGLPRHETVRGFNSLYGSHHKFYGAMDFFYVTAYYGGFTPGLQNAYLGISYSPVKNLTMGASYHFLATATSLKSAKGPLGHELESGISYTFLDCVTLSAGYTFMKGTETMVLLKRTTDNRTLHWGWIMLTVTPRLFSGKW